MKWYALHALAIAAALGFALATPPVPWFVRRHRLLLAALAALAVASTLRTGLARAAGPLLDRFAVVVVVLLLYAHLHRRGGDLRAFGGAVAVAVAATDAAVLAQHFGLQPLGFLTAGDSRSAFFGNVNMAAQFLGLATPCLLWTRSACRRRLHRVALDLLLVATLGSIAVLGSRSVLLATGLVLMVWIALRAAPATLVGAGLAASLLLAGILVRDAGERTSVSSPAMLADKAEATAIRLGLWQGTIRMIRDHPLGVGAGNFPDRFVPYQRVGLVPDEQLLYRWPHDEWLRVAAEDGLPFAGLAAVAAVLLGRAAGRGLRRRSRGPQDRAFLVSTAAALAVEATFQFPFAMAAAALIGALFVAHALYLADESEEPGTASPFGAEAARPALGSRRLAGAAWTALATGALVALLRVAGADYLLARAADDRRGLKTACALDPRRVEACVLAAWRQLRDGNRAPGRRTLARLLETSPDYYPALKLRAEDALAAGHREAACADLRRYDALFAGASSVHATVAAQCPAVAARASASAAPAERTGPPDGS